MAAAQFQKYPAYKNSSVECLSAKASATAEVGEIPEHWKVQKLKFLCKMIVSNVDKHSKSVEKEIRLCNYVDVYKNNFITSEISFMNATATSEEIKRFNIYLKDVIITKDSEDWKDIGVPALVKYTDENLVCGYHLAILRAHKNIIGEFLYYLLLSRYIKNTFSVNANGITRYGLSHNPILNTSLILPPKPEQTRIANFLDDKCTKIDKAIAQKEKLIELLKERRQIIIQNAVTGKIVWDGSDWTKPTKVKDSSIDWIGEIPDYWEAKKLKNVVNMIVSNVDKHIKTYEIPVELCNYVDVYKNNTVTKDIQFMIATASRDEIQKFKLKINDVIITKDSEDWLDIGVASLVEFEKDNLICGYHLAILRQLCEIKGIYLFYSLLSIESRTQFSVNANGVTRYGISHSVIKNVWLAIPPIQEQIIISEYLEKESAKIFKAIDLQKSQIEKLKEYKTTLIDSAVTGKIKI